MQDRFFGKTWMIWAVLIVSGTLGLFSVVFGLLFWTETMTDANGVVRPRAGPPMMITGSCLLAVAAMALANVVALMMPVIRCYREGVECKLVGANSLDGFSGIPNSVRIAWKVLSLEGFQSRRLRIQWPDFRGARVFGGRMAHTLRIDGNATDLKTGRARNGVSFPQSALKTPPQQIADALQALAANPALQDRLPSWARANG